MPDLQFGGGVQLLGSILAALSVLDLLFHYLQTQIANKLTQLFFSVGNESISGCLLAFTCLGYFF